MKNAICGFLLFFAFVTVCFAQQNVSNTDEKNGGSIITKAETKFSAQLQDTLDVETTKGNDDFVLKLTEDVSIGDLKIDKDSELLGRVVRVKKSTGGDDMSEISIFFDFIKEGDNYIPFKATVVSVAPENAGSGNSSGGEKSEYLFASSPVFKGATVISTKGKNLHFKEGAVFMLKTGADLVKQ